MERSCLCDVTVSVYYAVAGWETVKGVSISSYTSFPYCCLALDGEEEGDRVRQGVKFPS